MTNFTHKTHPKSIYQSKIGGAFISAGSTYSPGVVLYNNVGFINITNDFVVQGIATMVYDQLSNSLFVAGNFYQANALQYTERIAR